MGSRTLVAVFLALILGTGCDRPFVDPSPPEIEIIEPDLSMVLTDPEPEIAVRASSFRTIETVTLNGQPMRFNAAEQVWEMALELHQGLNRLIFSALDAEGAVTTDTAFAMHLITAASRGGPQLPEPRGGHTATLLNDGALVVIGGSRFPEGQALASVLSLPQAGTRFEAVSSRLSAARTGHTASLLPDGRILIAGGSRVGDMGSTADLVQSVEIYDPLTETFSRVPFRGDPIRRAFHTASIRSVEDGVILDLFGGRGDIQYHPTPLLGTRRDLRSFHFRNDSLIALSPAPGPSLEAAIWGHIQAPLESPTPGERNRYLVAGAFFQNGIEENTGFIFDYLSRFGIELSEAPELLVPRRRHAAAQLAPGLVAVFGGNSPNGVLNDVELFVEDAGRFYRFPPMALASRFGLTATKITPRRILLLGGFSADGQGVLSSDLFLTPPL